MMLLDSSSSASVAADGHVEARFGNRATRLHPQWLREQSTEPGQIEATNRQRLFTPLDVEPGLVAIDAELDGDTLTVVFSDGHRCRLSVAAPMPRLGRAADPAARFNHSRRQAHPAQSIKLIQTGEAGANDHGIYHRPSGQMLIDPFAYIVQRFRCTWHPVLHREETM